MFFLYQSLGAYMFGRSDMFYMDGVGVCMCELLQKRLLIKRNLIKEALEAFGSKLLFN